MIVPSAPIDVLRQAEKSDAPNFHRVQNARICYFCKFNEYTFRPNKFSCVKHDIGFGEKTSLQVEFTCDDWEEG